VAIELRVLLVLHLRARTSPQRLRLVHGFEAPVRALHAYREADVVGVLADQTAHARGVQELARVALQLQPHGGAALRPVGRRDRVLPVAPRRPAHPRLRGHARAPAEDLDLVRHDECRIEADTELPDQLRVLLLIAAEALEEAAGAGMSDGAELLD